jgi:hypothetical protein
MDAARDFCVWQPQSFHLTGKSLASDRRFLSEAILMMRPFKKSNFVSSQFLSS